MRRAHPSAIIWTGWILGLVIWLALIADYAHQKRQKSGATAPAPTPTPIVNIEPTPTLTIPIRPAMGRAVGRSRAPQGELTFSGPEGVLVIKWGTNWDAVTADCMRKLWALRSREFAPDTGEEWGNYPRHRDDRFGAAWKVCPGFRR